MTLNKNSFINFTPNGMIPTKTITPYVPESVDEIVESVLMAKERGAAIAHIHARGANGKPTWKGEVYGEIIEKIRKSEEFHEDRIILCASTSGRDWPEFEKRSECLQLTGDQKPDMASLTLSSLNFAQAASTNSPEMIQRLAKQMQAVGIKPELEIFETGMINYASYLRDKGMINGPFYFNLLFGNIASSQADAFSLGYLVSLLPDDSVWAAAGLGSAQLKMNVLGMLCGGGMRNGIEDNIWFDQNKQKLATNRDLLDRIIRLAHEFEISLMSPTQMRELLKL